MITEMNPVDEALAHFDKLDEMIGCRSDSERLWSREYALVDEVRRLRGEVLELRSNVNAAWRIERARCLAIVKKSAFWETAAKRIESGEQP